MRILNKFDLKSFKAKEKKALKDGVLTKDDADELLELAPRVIAYQKKPEDVAEKILTRVKEWGNYAGDDGAQEKVDAALHTLTVNPLELQVMGKTAKKKRVLLTRKEVRDILRKAFPNQKSLIKEVVNDSGKLDLLQRLDSKGKSTLDNILWIAKKKETQEGNSAKDLAINLLGQIGAPFSDPYGACYARCAQSAYLMTKPAEFVRIVGELAIDGRTKLAGGFSLKWDSALFSFEESSEKDLPSFLWGSMCAKLRKKDADDGDRLFHDEGYAYRGEMANIMTRLTGVRHVNVRVDYSSENRRGASKRRIETVEELLEEFGPMLAEFDEHGGALHRVGEDGKLFSLEEGGEEEDFSYIGYLVAPKAAAKRAGLEKIEYGKSDASGYL